MTKDYTNPITVSDAAVRGFALYITGAEGVIQPNGTVVNGETVLSLPYTDYVVEITTEGYLVQSSGAPVLFKFVPRCPEIPDELLEALPIFGIELTQTYPTESWTELLSLIEELDEQDKIDFESILSEIW